MKQERIGVPSVQQSPKWLLAGVAACAMLGPVAVAQEVDETVVSMDAPEAAGESEAARAERERRLGIVTVSARRRDESLRDAPVAITAFSGEAMEGRSRKNGAIGERKCKSSPSDFAQSNFPAFPLQ